MGTCGPSSQEQQLAGQEQTFANTLQQNYQTQFADQSEVLNNLNHTLTPIVEAGPNQEGFSPAELASFNTQALNTTGGNYANAARALNSQLAGRGGDSGLESGVDQQIKASLASGAAGTLSNEQLGITQANYATGRQNFQNATGGLQALSGDYNPAAYASLGTSANSSAFSQAKDIQAQKAAMVKDIAGAATAGLGALTGGLGNLDTTGGSSVGEQFLNFAEGV